MHHDLIGWTGLETQVPKADRSVKRSERKERSEAAIRQGGDILLVLRPGKAPDPRSLALTQGQTQARLLEATFRDLARAPHCALLDQPLVLCTLRLLWPGSRAGSLDLARLVASNKHQGNPTLQPWCGSKPPGFCRPLPKMSRTKTTPPKKGRNTCQQKKKSPNQPASGPDCLPGRSASGRVVPRYSARQIRGCSCPMKTSWRPALGRKQLAEATGQRARVLGMNRFWGFTKTKRGGWEGLSGVVPSLILK